MSFLKKSKTLQNGIFFTKKKFEFCSKTNEKLNFWPFLGQKISSLGLLQIFQKIFKKSEKKFFPKNAKNFAVKRTRAIFDFFKNSKNFFHFFEKKRVFLHFWVKNSLFLTQKLE